MEIPSGIADLAPVLVVLLIAFLKSRKPKEPEKPCVVQKDSALPSPSKKEMRCPTSNFEEVSPPVETCVPAKKRKRRSARDLVIAQVILERPTHRI